MTKRVVVVFISALILVLVGSVPVFAFCPNYATNSHEDMSFNYYGYVQCQPSFVENGTHAARGYLRYQRMDLSGNVNKDTGRLYTESGLGPHDSRILSRSYTFKDSAIPNKYKTQFYYGFDRVSAGSGIWPFSLSNAELVK